MIQRGNGGRVADRTRLVSFGLKPWPMHRLFGLVALIQVSCAVLFGVDIAYELHRDLLATDLVSWTEVIHLTVECMAVGLLLVGYSLSHRQMVKLLSRDTEQAGQLHSLRGHFDDILKQRFADWELSRAECDIALLSLRGLKISEIARLRATKEGTIKAQLSAIFRKAGVATRTELLGVFLDEFLDFGANQDEVEDRKDSHG